MRASSFASFFHFILMAERIGMFRDILHDAISRAKCDDGDAREDERRRDPVARAPLLVRAEHERRYGEGDERL